MSMKLKRNELLEKVYNGISKTLVEADKLKSLKHDARVITRYWPTEASALSPIGPVGRCRRRTYYAQKLGVDDTEIIDHDMRTLGRFKVGNIIEKWIQDTIKDAGMLRDTNIKLRYNIPESNLQISGEIDLIYNIGDEIVGGEIKSSYGYDFTNTVVHKQTIPGMPKVEHIMQVILYIYYHKYIDTSLGIDRFIITYIDRGSMDLYQHCIELSDDLYPIVNGIVLKDIYNNKNPILGVKGFNYEKTRNKLLPYEINLQNIFDRYKDIYNHLDAGLLIQADYNPMYSNEEITDGALSGKISKSKYADYKSGNIDFICDKECNYCNFRTQCLKDSGII